MRERRDYISVTIIPLECVIIIILNKNLNKDVKCHSLCWVRYISHSGVRTSPISLEGMEMIKRTKI